MCGSCQNPAESQREACILPLACSCQIPPSQKVSWYPQLLIPCQDKQDAWLHPGRRLSVPPPPPDPSAVLRRATLVSLLSRLMTTPTYLWGSLPSCLLMKGRFHLFYSGWNQQEHCVYVHLFLKPVVFLAAAVCPSSRTMWRRSDLLW